MRSRGLVGFVVLASTMTGCGDTDEVTNPRFEPATPGVLTVATTLPAPGFWNGEPDAPDGGFEWAIATELAAEFGLELRVVDVAFDDISSGELADADLAISQISVTDARDEVVDFSVGYYDTDSGVVGREGDEMADLKTARERTWAVLGGSTHEAFLHDVVRPEVPPVVLGDDVAVARAVADGDVDAGLFDLTTALTVTHVVAGLETVAQFDTDERYAIALPSGSPNLEVVDAVMRRLESDGSLASFVEEWLEPVFERDPADVPHIVAKQ